MNSIFKQSRAAPCNALKTKDFFAASLLMENPDYVL